MEQDLPENRLEEQLQASLEMSAAEFRDSLRTNASVLVLGQKYQTACFGKEYFLQAAGRELAPGADSAAQDYTQLWKQIAAKKKLLYGETEFAPLSPEQCKAWEPITDQACEALKREAAPAMERTNRMLRAGWRLVATTAPETMLRTIPNSPFSPKKTVLHTNVPLPQTFRATSLSLLQMFTPGEGLNLSFEEPDLVWESEGRATTTLAEALRRAIPYSGYLVLDGWDPTGDWFGAGDLIRIMQGLMYDDGRDQIQVLCFGMDEAAAGRAFASIDRTKRRLLSRILFLDGHLADLFPEEAEPAELPQLGEDFYHLHLMPVQGREHPLDITIPVKEWEKMPFASKASLLPLEPTPQSSALPMDRETQMTAFLAQDGNVPVWDDFDNCYFERDQYALLRDKVQKSLRVSGQRTDFLLLKGPACSGKTVMLGRLALDVSVNYPTIYLGPSALPRDEEGDDGVYARLATFILEWLTKAMSARRFNRKRVLVIWDGGFYESEARGIYYRLRRQLQRSVEFLLVGSAYAKPRSSNSAFEDEVVLAPELSTTEQENLFAKLHQNLGLDIVQFRKALLPEGNVGGRRQRNTTEENTLLSVLSHLFHGVNEDISQRLAQGPIRENQAARIALQKALDHNLEELEEARHDGALVTALKAYDCDWDSDAMRERITRCAGLLDDILAVAGSWRQSLHFELVFRVMEDLYRERFHEPLGNLGRWQDLLNALLDYSPMIHWDGEDSSTWVLRYRSALEARMFLKSKYPRQLETEEDARQAAVVSEGTVLGMAKRTIYCYRGQGGAALRDQVAVEILCSVLKNGRLNEGNNEFAYEALHLADCFGPNAEGETVAAWWHPYIAQNLVRHGSENVAALQKAAFLLRHYDWDESCETAMREGRPMDAEHYDRQLEVYQILEKAIRLIEKEHVQVSPRQQIQLYTEWCCNRRFIYCPHAPFVGNLPEEERLLVEQRLEYGEQLMQEVEDVIRSKLFPLAAVTDEYGNRHIVNIYNDMLVATARVYWQQKPQDLRPLADHMNFYWQYILFGLMDLGALIDDQKNSQLSKINEILDTWRKLSQGTQWEAGANQYYKQQDLNLYQTDPGSWWTNRITSLWHESLPDQAPEADRTNWLKDNLYLRSLEFRKEEDSSTLSPQEQQLVRHIVDVMEGRQPDGKEPLLRLPDGRPATGCQDIFTGYMDNHLRLQEYYVRAKWMAETNFFPYTDTAPVCLNQPYWKTIEQVCNNYCEQGAGYANDFFLYYLRAVLRWVNSRDSWDVQRRRQPEMFRACAGHLRMPRNGRYSTSYLLLCWSNGKPVRVRCTVDLDEKSGKINDVLEPNLSQVTKQEHLQVSQQLIHKYIYVAEAVLDVGQTSGNNYVFGIRFNREGPLAAPVTREG